MALTAALLLAALHWSPSARPASVPRSRGLRLRAPEPTAVKDPDALLAHMTPNPELSLEETIHCICRGLQKNDDPVEDTGVGRLYHFLSNQGRVALAPPPPVGGMQGGVTLEYFLANAASPALGALIFCNEYELMGPASIMPATMAHGQLATQILEVRNDPEAVPEADTETPFDPELAKIHLLEQLVQTADENLETILDDARAGRPMPAEPQSLKAKAKKRPSAVAQFVLQLEQEKRPPNLGCWVLKEAMPLQKTKFQELCEGGEEFEGEDSG